MIDYCVNKIRSWNRKRLAYRSRDGGYPSDVSDGGYPHVLGVLGIMKNESQNINEWMSHYVAVGAEKIYLIDNGSTDDTIAKARVWVDRGLLELIKLPQKHLQRQHYWTAIKHFNIHKACRWLIIADLDEFWFCPDGSSMPEKLQEFDVFDLIYCNWRMFGSSGLEKHPTSIRESFIHSDPKLNSHINTKFICRTELLKEQDSFDLHKVYTANSSKTVSDNHNFHLNHYAIQSREFFEGTKMKRGDATTMKFDSFRDWTYFNRYNAPCTQENRLLADLVRNGRLGNGPN